MYVIGESEVDILKEEIKNLKEQLDRISSESDSKQGKNTLQESGKDTTLPDTNYEKRLKELESDLDFQMKEYEKLENQTKEEV